MPPKGENPFFLCLLKYVFIYMSFVWGNFDTGTCVDFDTGGCVRIDTGGVLILTQGQLRHRSVPFSMWIYTYIVYFSDPCSIDFQYPGFLKIGYGADHISAFFSQILCHGGDRNVIRILIPSVSFPDDIAHDAKLELSEMIFPVIQRLQQAIRDSRISVFIRIRHAATSLSYLGTKFL